MPNTSFDAHELKYRGAFGRGPWSLCLGAGISNGIVPDWLDLTVALVNATHSLPMSRDEFAELVIRSGWTLDGWIQASLNRYLRAGHSVVEFYALLRGLLYEGLLARAQARGVEQDLVLALNDPFHAPAETIESVCQFFEAEYRDCTAVQIANALIDSCEQGRPPHAVITLNADCILDGLVTLLNMRRGLHADPPEFFRPARFFRAMRGIDDFRGRIPVYHLHGALFPSDGIAGKHRRKDAQDKLIFEEGAYSRTSGSMYSWAQSTFLYHAQTDRLVFVGMSMSDPNVRRWLGWTHQRRSEEFRESLGREVDAPQHMWIRTSAKTTAERALIEPALLHLGVRALWIHSWADAALSLSHLIGLRGVAVPAPAV